MRPARDELKYINTVQVLYQMQMYDDMCSGVRVAAPRRAAWNFICMTRLMKLYLLNFKSTQIKFSIFYFGLQSKLGR